MISESLRAELQALLPRSGGENKPGGAVGVVSGGQLRFAEGYGLADLETGATFTPHTLFHICSITKTFTGTLACLLEAEGKLSLDHDVRRYWPELPDYGVPLTLRHLVTNTSGLRDYFPLAFLEQGVAPSVYDREFLERHALRAPSLMFVPGSRFAYSNSNFVLLCRIMERLEGATYSEILRRRIFAPLRMEGTEFLTQTLPHPEGAARGYFQSPDGYRWPQIDVHEAGDGGIWSTIEDLGRWVAALVGGTIGDKSFVQRLREPPILTDGERGRYACGFGLGWRNGAPWFGHAGGLAGMSTNIVCFPEHDLAVVAACNGPDGDAEELSLKVADLFLPTPPAAPKLQRARPSPSLAGVWHHEGGAATAEISLNEEGASLWIQGWEIALEARAPDVLEDDATESSVRLLAPDLIEVRPSWGRKFQLRRLAPASGPLPDIVGVYEGVDVRARHEVTVANGHASIAIARPDGDATTCGLKRIGERVFHVLAPGSDRRTGAVAFFEPDGDLLISMSKAERVRLRRAI